MSVFKKIIVSLLIFLALAGTSLYIISLRYEKIVSNAILSQLNKLLITEVKVDELSVSPWVELPYVSLEFKNVLISDPLQDSDTLLSAKALFFHFNVLDLLREDYSIKKLGLADGLIRVKKNTQGEFNYKIWRSTDDSTSTILNLQSIKIDNSTLRYIDEASRGNIGLQSQSLILKIRNGDNETDIDLYGKAISEHCIIRSKDYLNSRDLRLDLGMKVNHEPLRVGFHRASLEVDHDIAMDVRGYISSESMKLELLAEKAKLNKLVDLLPFDFIDPMKKLKIKGDSRINLNIDHNNFDSGQLEVGLSTLISSAEIQTEAGQKIKIPYLSAVFRSKGEAGKKSMLSIDSASVKSGRTQLGFQMQLNDLESPRIRLKTSGKIDLAEWIKNDSSEFKLKSGLFSGSTELQFIYHDSLGIKDFGSSQNKVLGKITDLKLETSKSRYEIHNADIEVAGGHLILSDAQLGIAEDEIEAQLLVRNALQYLRTNGDQVEIESEIKTKHFDLDQFLEDLPGSENEGVSFPKLKARVKANSFQFLQNELENVSFHLTLNSNLLKVSDAAFNYAEGSMKSDLSMMFSSKNSELQMSCDFKQLDISELFRNFNNFDQDVLQSNNLKGKCTGEANLNMSFNENFDYIPSSIRSIVSLTISNGSLIKFEPMQAVADYFDSNLILRKLFKAKELREKVQNIEFETLSNDFFIRNEEVYMPSMDIKSSVLDINIEGVYAFDNTVEYRLDFYITDLLARNQKSIEFSEEVIDDGTGRKRIFLIMTGPIDDPEFSIDKERRKAYRKGIVKSEESIVKGVLKEELGLFKNDSSAVIQKDPEPEFELIWDPDMDEDSTVTSPKIDTVKKEKGLKGVLKRLIEEGESNKSTDDFEWDEDDL